jgi:hypothetical protein
MGAKSNNLTLAPRRMRMWLSNKSAAPQSLLAAVAVSRSFRWISKKIDYLLKPFRFSAH